MHALASMASVVKWVMVMATIAETKMATDQRPGLRHRAMGYDE